MNITTPELGWIILALLVAGDALATLQGWFSGQYEITLGRRRAHRPSRPRIARRWYGTGAHVRLRGTAVHDKPARYLVLGWDGEAVTVPWLLLDNLDADDAEPFWAPVTDYAPFTVRRLRPYLDRDGRVPVVRLRDYLPLRSPSGYLGGARDAA